MQVAYFKMHGTGNKILVVDQRRENRSPPSATRLRELGDDSSGPGFDQLMWVGPPRAAGSVASYRVFNADGSEVEQCGNGVRCVARVLADDSQQTTSFTLESPAGQVAARIDDDGQISVTMGAPEFEPSRIPFVADGRSLLHRLHVDERSLDVSVVSMGNPHCVLQVDDIETAPVSELGPKIERHERFPERANVGFMEIVDRGNIRLRVHERGVGETLACGTGACAAVVTGRELDLLDERVNVQLPGGQVVVSWRGGSDTVWLTGNAELISEGSIDL